MARQNAEKRKTKARKKRQAEARKPKMPRQVPMRAINMGDGLAAGMVMAALGASGLPGRLR